MRMIKHAYLKGHEDHLTLVYRGLIDCQELDCLKG